MYSFCLWQDTLELCIREVGFKSVLFFFSALLSHCVAGRLQFGLCGWNERNLLSARDLTVCMAVLCNYLETPTKIRNSGQVTIHQGYFNSVSCLYWMSGTQFFFWSCYLSGWHYTMPLLSMKINQIKRCVVGFLAVDAWTL